MSHFAKVTDGKVTQVIVAEKEFFDKNEPLLVKDGAKRITGKEAEEVEKKVKDEENPDLIIQICHKYFNIPLPASGIVHKIGVFININRQQRQRSPHPTLIVRVAGYSDYFCDLTPALQDEIIARTEHDSL